MKNSNIKIRKLSQWVLESKDNSKQVEQSVNYDQVDEWVNVIHAGNEISLSRENWNQLNQLVNNAITIHDENNYQRLKNMTLKESALILAKMEEAQILELIQEDAQTNVFKWFDISGFRKNLLSELFKRNGLGYKQMGMLSTKQHNFLKALNLYNQ